MLDLIKNHIEPQFPLTESKGIFFSAFDKDNNLIGSHGVISTNKPLWTVIDMLYHGILEPQKNNILTLVCDIVGDTKVLNTMEDISSINLEESGICLSTIDYTKSGIILPNTVGLNSISQALQIVKEKNHIEWNVILHSFTSTKIEIKVK